jgi:hypothetical protein
MGWREWLGMKPRITDFAQRILDEFRLRGADDWTFDSENSLLRCTGSNAAQINLVNIFLEYSQAARSQRPALIQKYAAFCEGMKQGIPKLWELAAKSIYPVVRSRFDRKVTATALRGESDGSAFDVLAWPYIGDLEIRIAYDWGPHLGTVSTEVADAWGQSEDAIRERAVQNLAALPPPRWEEVRPGVFALVTDNSYEESLFLVDKVVDKLPFDGPAVCSSCNRGVLLAADASKTEAVLALIDEAIRNLQQKPWPLSGTLLVRGPNGWQAHVPDGEAGVKAGELARISEFITYRDQKAVLDEYHEKHGIDVFVATYSLFRRSQDGGTLRSWSAWVDGIPSLLPRTDFVALTKGKTDHEERPALLPWERAVAMLGRYLRETEDDPKRFSVSERLSDADWVAIGSDGRAAV